MISDSQSGSRAPARLLVRGVNWLGDAVMTTPALLRLRERLSETEITLLAPEKLASLFEGHPAIDALLPITPGSGVWTTAVRLKSRRFDAALVLPNSPRSALEPFLARIPDRIGFARPWRTWFLTRNIPERPGKVAMRKLTLAEIHERVSRLANQPPHAAPGNAIHQSNDYLHLAAEAFGCDRSPIAPLLRISSEEVSTALSRFGLDPRETLLGINPGAEYGPAKRWPAERFIRAGKAVQEHVSVKWLILGAAADTELCGKIAAELNTGPRGHAFNLAGRTSLRELMALLRSCRAVLTNDSGPMHVAAALGVPVVVPFGSTSPELTGPLPPAGHAILRANAPCSPCYLRSCPIDFRCMLAIEPHQASEALLKHLPAGG